MMSEDAICVVAWIKEVMMCPIITASGYVFLVVLNCSDKGIFGF